MTTLSPSGKQALDDLVVRAHFNCESESWMSCFGLQAQLIAVKTIPSFVYGVTNLDEEIYFHGGGPNVVGDPSSGEVGPDSIMWICSQTKMIASVSSSSVSSSPELIHWIFSVGCLEISRARQNHVRHSRS